MKHFLIAFIFLNLISCGKKSSEDDAPGEQQEELKLTKEESKAAGQLYGYKETNQMLSERLFSSDAQLRLSYYLEPVGFPNQATIDFVTKDVVTLLGGQQANGQKSEMVNANPNPMNTLLWFVVLEQFSKDLSETCDGGKAISHHGYKSEQMRPEIVTALKDACSTNINDSAFDQKITNLMHVILLFDGTDLDEKLVLEYARSDIYKDKSGKDALKDLLTTILYNPNLLIRK